MTWLSTQHEQVTNLNIFDLNLKGFRHKRVILYNMFIKWRPKDLNSCWRSRKTWLNKIMKDLKICNLKDEIALNSETASGNGPISSWCKALMMMTTEEICIFTKEACKIKKEKKKDNKEDHLWWFIYRKIHKPLKYHRNSCENMSAAETPL